jgi:signal transduction histidine kinase
VARQLVLEEPVRSAVAARVRRRGAGAGGIGVYRRTVEPFDDDDEQLLNQLSQQAGIALDNAYAYAELQSTRDRLQALIEVTDAILRLSSFEEIVKLVVDQAQLLLPGIACLVGVVTVAAPGRLNFVAATPGLAAPLQGTVHEFAQVPVASRAIQSGRPLETSEFSRQSPLAPLMQSTMPVDTARLVPLGEPLPDGRSRLGVLGFYREGNTPFSAEERLLMDEFGKRVGVALQRAELLRLAGSTTARLQTAVDVAADISASLDPSEVIRRVLVRAVEAGRADRGVLLRIDGDETVVEDYHDISGLEDIIGYRHRIALQPLMRQAVRTRRPTIGGRYEVGRMQAPLSRSLEDVKHTATIPLVLDGQVTAVLVLSRRTDPPFVLDDLVTFQLIANQAVLALRNARLFAQAQAVTRAQSDFLNMAAHELRTPLSVIAGYVSMMADGTLGEVPHGWGSPIETLRAKAAELESLISELLIASRLEAGTIPVHRGLVELREAVFSALERVAPRAGLLGAHLRHRFPEDPVLAAGDAEQVARVLDNLLNNALSYGAPPQEVAVTVHGGTEPRVEVRDRGQGISPEERIRIFERFYRIEDPALRHVPGTGLGLYISRELANRMGGSLTLDRSAPGKGSTFSLRLRPADPVQ